MQATTVNLHSKPVPAQRVLPVALRFVRAHIWPIAGTSAAVLIPCFWHRRIEAGDLASHVYNAWLAQLIEQGQAPGLYLARQWNNVACDVLLTRLGSLIGFSAAEKIVVSLCVLIFFWGAFALACAIARRVPWFLAPCFAMLAYGYTFSMGFLNCYLSLGLAFFGLAIFWRGRGTELLAGLALSALALLAHPMGFLWLAAATAYVQIWKRLPSRLRLFLPVMAGVGLFGAHWYLGRHYEVGWLRQPLLFFNGADQLALYGERYAKLAAVACLFGLACFLIEVMSRERRQELWRDARIAVELYIIAYLALGFLPENLRVSWYAGWVGLLASRLTTISAVLGLCVLSCLRPRRWHLAGFVACAGVFFAFLYQDTDVLNKMERQAEQLVSGLPYGHRVMATIWAPPGSRLSFIGHMVDRACIGRCFSYGNYEPSSKQFRVRVRPGSPVVTASVEDSEAMGAGEYEVQEEDLPVAQVYQCDGSNLTRLCMRQLSAGELNGRIGYHPPED